MNLVTALLFGLLAAMPARHARAIPPPLPAAHYYKSADAVAGGAISDLKIKKLQKQSYRVSFVFTATRFWKGKDAKRFRYSHEVFDPMGNEESLRRYYGDKEYAFFYKKSRGKSGKTLRDSVFITPLTESLASELAALQAGKAK